MEAGSYYLAGGDKPLSETQQEGEDIGGGVSDCSTADLKCLALGSMLFSFPQATDSQLEWTQGDIRFTRVGATDSAQGQRIFVSAKPRDWPEYFYVYSRKRGVEIIMFGPKEAFPFGTTFILDGDVGPLAQRARK